MVHINYFLLLLFCISTNMVHGMIDSMDLTQSEFNLQIQEGTCDSWGRNSISSNETRGSSNFPQRKFFTLEELISQQNTPASFDDSPSESGNLWRRGTSVQSSDLVTQQLFYLDAEEFFNSDNMLAKQQTKEQQKNSNCHFQQPSAENFETEPQQSISQSLLPIDLQLSCRTESPMSSDVEDSTVFGQKFDDQKIIISGQSSSKQRPRKKRKTNKNDVPDDVYFTIICNRCFPTKQFYSFRSYDLIVSFKRHSKEKHSSMTDNERKTFTKTRIACKIFSQLSRI